MAETGQNKGRRKAKTEILPKIKKAETKERNQRKRERKKIPRIKYKRNRKNKGRRRAEVAKK